jgi:hypothetical protein
MSFNFSFLWFFLCFCIFTISTTMKNLWNEGFAHLVLGVLKDTLLTSIIPPSQLLNLKLYGFSLVRLPTPTFTTKVGDDFGGLVTNVRSMCSVLITCMSLLLNLFLLLWSWILK